MLCTILLRRVAASVTLIMLRSLMTVPICGLTAMRTGSGRLLIICGLGSILFRITGRYRSPAQSARITVY